MNKDKLGPILLIFIFCISNIFVVTLISQIFTLAAEDNQKNYNLNLDLQGSILNQEVTLIVGSNEDAVRTGVLAFKSSLNSDVEINKQDIITSSDNNDIIVIFSHGSEQGMILNNELISWYDLSKLISQTKADYIVLAACYGANIYDLIEIDGKQVIGFDGEVDALIMAYFSALLVNSYFNHNDEADSNFESFISRVILILKQPEQIQALYCDKIEKKDKFWWFIPTRLSVLFHIKLTEAEIDLGDDIIIKLEQWVLKYLASIPRWVIAILLAEVYAIVHISAAAYDNQGVPGAWVTLMTMLLPGTGIWWQARKPNGDLITSIPINPGDPTMTATIGSILRQNLHDWRCY